MKNQKNKILYIEDDMGLALTVSDRLHSESFVVTHLANSENLEKVLFEDKFTLILLDLMLPNESGFEICKKIRQNGIFTPILILTAISQTEEKVKCLKIGADDYLTKPFDFSELSARIEALIRRSKQQTTESNNILIGDIEINLKAREVYKTGVLLDLSIKEFQLLKYLVFNKGRSISRSELLEEIWGYDASITTRTIDTHIGWLRQKLEDDPKKPKYIVTSFGFGYKFSNYE